jgi:hypothetical protein
VHVRPISKIGKQNNFFLKNKKIDGSIRATPIQSVHKHNRSARLLAHRFFHKIGFYRQYLGQMWF